jgi:hypothetical protein
MSEPHRKQRLLVAGITVLGCLLIAFFGVRALHAFKKFGGHLPPPPAGEIETDVGQIREWMTVPFIARAYGVPGEILFDALGIPPQGNHKKSLKELNEEYHPEADGYVIETVKSAILSHQTPPPPAPPTQPDSQPAPAP